VSNVLIRHVSPEDLERIRGAAAQRGTTLQAYLWETVHAQAAFEIEIEGTPWTDVHRAWVLAQASLRYADASVPRMQRSA
jgi:hypothetical protein